MSRRGVFAGFGRTLVFAAAVAFAAPIALALLVPVLGAAGGFCAYALGSTALYTAGLGGGATRGLAAAAAILGACFALLIGGAGPYSTLIVGAVLLGVLRSGWLCRSTRSNSGDEFFARSFAIEALLVAGGLGLASLLAAGDFFPISLALWGFFLAQSAFFLIGGPSAHRSRRGAKGCAAHSDAFDSAVRRARGLIDGRPTA